MGWSGGKIDESNGAINVTSVALTDEFIHGFWFPFTPSFLRLSRVHDSGLISSFVGVGEQRKQISMAYSTYIYSANIAPRTIFMYNQPMLISQIET